MPQASPIGEESSTGNFLPKNASWTRTSNAVPVVHVDVHERRDGQSRQVVFAFPETAHEGLLYQALIALPVVGMVQARDFRRLLPRLLQAPDVQVVLEQAPSGLNRADICSLFERIENIIDALPLAPSTKEQASRSTRHCLQYCKMPLADGWRVNDSGFKSKFVRPRQAGNQGSRRAFPLQGELQVLEFHTLEERRVAAYDLHLNKQESLVRGWISILDEHALLSQRLKRLSSLGLDGLPKKMRGALQRGNAPNPEPFERLPEDDKLRVALYIASRNEGQSVGDANSGDYVNLTHITSLHRLSIRPAQVYLSEIVLAHRFLPRKVLLSCLCILMSRTAQNGDTAQGLKLSSVRKIAGRGYQLVGIKGKTDQIQTFKIFSSEEELPDSDLQTVVDVHAARALELLMQNAEHICNYTHQTDVPLFSAFHLKQRGPLRFITLRAGKLVTELRLLGDTSFDLTLSDLRPLSAHLKYLSVDGDIFQVQAMLGHADPETTAIYLRSTILQALGEANMNRYMKVLAASLFIASQRTDLAERTKLVKHANPRLLFPYGNGEQEASSCLVDDWIEAAGNMKLTIGPDELEHLAFQHRYYLSHQQQLTSANPKQFIRLHLPRIAICIAMRRVVMQSSHRVAYLKFERTMYDADGKN